MKTLALLEEHARKIKGVLECYDRVVLAGTYQAIGWPEAMGSFLGANGITHLEFARTKAREWADEVNTRVRKVAREERVEVRQVGSGERKEEVVTQLLEKRGRRPGVVCVLGAMERCRSLRVREATPGGPLRLQWGPGKCQHFYVYVVDEELGLCHLRIPTWAPFRLQFCCNGHDWLAQQMRAAGLRFTQADNCFTHLSDMEAAQKLVRRFDPVRLHRRLDELAARWVSIHARFGHSLHWSIAQAEWSTDILFKNDRVLPELFQQIVRTAVIEVGCGDIYRFVGKKWRGLRSQEISSRLQTLVQGTRLKHTLGKTSLKVYDKAGSVLRIECTTRDVTTFTHYRKVKPRQSQLPDLGPAAAGSSGASAKKWAPMRKTFYSLGVLALALSRCNRRYLAYLSQWRDQTQERQALHKITASCRDAKDRSVRGVNFFRDDDLLFLRALQRGEHQIQGLRNRTLQPHLPDWSPPKIGRALRRFKVLKLLKPVHGTRKYYPTANGERLIAAGLQLTQRIILPALEPNKHRRKHVRSSP
jgi:hypothetical protein